MHFKMHFNKVNNTMANTGQGVILLVEEMFDQEFFFGRIILNIMNFVKDQL